MYRNTRERDKMTEFANLESKKRDGRVRETKLEKQCEKVKTWRS